MDCAGYATLNYCEDPQYRSFMRLNCPYACSLCGIAEQEDSFLTGSSLKWQTTEEFLSLESQYLTDNPVETERRRQLDNRRRQESNGVACANAVELWTGDGADTSSCNRFRGIHEFSQDTLDTICIDDGNTDKTTNATICSTSNDPPSGNPIANDPALFAQRLTGLRLAIVNKMYGDADLPHVSQAQCHQYCMY